MGMPTATALAAARPARNSIESGSSPIVTALCVAVASCAGLTGCASGTKNNTIPSDGPTMAEIYRQHMAGVGQRSAPSERDFRPQRSPEDPPDLGSYQRTVATEIDNRFTRLPNPDLVMYVAPHLSANGRYPVPGYSTVFPMYETVEYAMPGEIQWRRASQAPTTNPSPSTAAAAARPRAVVAAEPAR
jgi:conjugative transfer region lipoprotein (TIGR03751 family)